MDKINRVVIILMDSAGVGELPDAAKFGDVGSNTIGNVSRKSKNFSMPEFQKMGLGNITNINNVASTKQPTASFAKMAELSAGKDTTNGHWELMGVVSEDAFPTYPNGFPEDLLAEFTNKTGLKVLGNKTASGTVIIDELGKEHMESGSPIVYTSADSVFQIAAHEEIIPIEKLYEICEASRELLHGEHGVARVIARPFIGTPGNFTRTTNRKDFSLVPPMPTVLEKADKKGLKVTGIGKIDTIFAYEGINGGRHTADNTDGIKATFEYMKKEKGKGVIFTNLCDFDMLYGHRNNVQGYADALMQLDSKLPEFLAELEEDDVLIITADHGCDPTMPGSDHSREYIPLLVYGKNLKNGVDLGVRKSFADLGATIADWLELEAPKWGESFAGELQQ